MVSRLFTEMAGSLFCGLSNGKIVGFLSATGHRFELTEHSKEVHAMALIDHVLISGDFSGVLKFWKAGVDLEGRPTFNCVSTINLGTGIKCIKEIVVATSEGTTVK